MDGSERIPGMHLADVDWAMPLHHLGQVEDENSDVPPVAPPKSPMRGSEGAARRRRRATVHNAEESDASDTEDLANKVNGVHVFQELASTASKDRTFQRKSAVPEGLDLKKIREVREANILIGEKVVEDGDEIAVPARDEEFKGMIGDEESGGESEGFESVALPTGLKTELNGKRRRWYRLIP